MTMDIGFGRPLSPATKAIVGSGWGRPRGDSHDHQGIDIWVPVGTPVYAVAPGVVLRSYNVEREAAGKYVAIQHAKGWMSRYMHLSEAIVPVGSIVQRGQLIGRSGNTGVGSTGPHLHFDLKLDPTMVPRVAAEVGTPAGGFGPNQPGFGVGVPAEPWIPVDGYSDRTIEEAAANGVLLEPNRPRIVGISPLGRLAIGGLALGALSVWGVVLWRKRQHQLVAM